MNIRVLVLFGLMSCLSGCGGVRLIIDVVPAVDGLTETVVLEDPGAGSSAKIALIQITGMIADADRPGLITKGENPVSRLVESLRKAAKDSKIKAIVLRINSPGGTVTASDIVYREIQHFKRTTKKPVVVLMSDVAASGGYYIACAGDEIIAHPTTITGSIGVIIQTFNFSEGMRRIGIKADAITSGPNKAAGSPFEPMPPEHRALLQGLVDEFYDNFVAIVTESPRLRANSSTKSASSSASCPRKLWFRCPTCKVSPWMSRRANKACNNAVESGPPDTPTTNLVPVLE